MKKLQNFKASNLTEDQMRKVLGGRATSYTDNKGGSGSDEATNGETSFDHGGTASGDTRTSR